MSGTANGASSGWQAYGQRPAVASARFRYSAVKVRSAAVAAVIMTAMICALSWMLLRAANHPKALAYTAMAGLVFFAFVSAAMLVAHLRNSVVLAVLPTGLYDARWQAEPVAWQEIREIVLRRVEDEFELDVFLWPGPRNRGRPHVPDHTIQLAPLDAPVATVVAALQPHAELRADRNSALAVSP